jgi:hypothetical protein
MRREVFAPVGLTALPGSANSDRDCRGQCRAASLLGRRPQRRSTAATRTRVPRDFFGGCRRRFAAACNDMLTWMRMWLDPGCIRLGPGTILAEPRTDDAHCGPAHTPMPMSERQKRWDNGHFSCVRLRLAAVGRRWRATRVAHPVTLGRHVLRVSRCLPDKAQRIRVHDQRRGLAGPHRAQRGAWSSSSPRPGRCSAGPLVQSSS